MSKYGTSRDLGGETGLANPLCKCNPMQAMYCPFGHMLECHIPMTCREADCYHYRRQMDNEREQ
jgi:hypothetical protein